MPIQRSRRRFGALRKLASGRWQASYLRDGQRINAPHTFATKTDAQQWLNAVETDQARGVHVDHRKGRVTFREVAESWMANAQPRLKIKTWHSYRSLLDSVILPTWGEVEIGKIQSSRVRQFVTDTSERLSASRTRQATRLLSKILSDAVLDGLLAANPCAGVKTPRLPQREVVPLPLDQAEKLIEAAEPPYDLLLSILTFGGLRIGEALALRRSDCEMLKRRVRVAQSVAEVGGHLSISGTKTHRTRYVSLPKSVIIRLAQHLEAVDPDPEALLFPARDGGPLRYSKVRDRAWLPALAAAGLDPKKITMHQLRHTCASLLIESGASPVAVANHLGHVSPAITLSVYSHLFEGTGDLLADRLDDLRRKASARA